MGVVDRTVDDPRRSRSDRKHDAARRPKELLRLLDLLPGMTVLEIEPGKGWFTDVLLAYTASLDAKLTVQQPQALEGFFGRAAAERVTRHDHASFSDAPFEALAPHPGTIDRVVWLQGPHELWFEPEPGESLGDPVAVFAGIARVLKPDGRLLVVDNLAPEGSTEKQAGALHRSRPETIARRMVEAGLTLDYGDTDFTTCSDPLDVPTYDRRVHLRTRQYVQVYQPAV